MTVRSKPFRQRDREHLKFVATHPCLACGRSPSDAHHVKFAEQRAMGRKVSDEYTVPLCRLHHRELHRHGDERKWWQQLRIDPLIAASAFWNKTRSTQSIGTVSHPDQVNATPPHQANTSGGSAQCLIGSDFNTRI